MLCFRFRKRVIDRLRCQFPGVWTYDRQANRWYHEDGWAVEPRSCLAPRYDGDDDSFVTLYLRIDTNEWVLI